MIAEGEDALHPCPPAKPPLSSPCPLERLSVRPVLPRSPVSFSADKSEDGSTREDVESLSTTPSSAEREEEDGDDDDERQAVVRGSLIQSRIPLTRFWIERSLLHLSFFSARTSASAVHTHERSRERDGQCTYCYVSLLRRDPPRPTLPSTCLCMPSTCIPPLWMYACTDLPIQGRRQRPAKTSTNRYVHAWTGTYTIGADTCTSSRKMYEANE